jgi:hypothetical protein
MPTYRIDGELYEAASPDEAYAKHDRAMATKMAMREGAQLSPVAQGALTAAQGATFNFADELAGLVNPRYRDVVRGATQEFAQRNPMGAAGLELAGGLATAPFTGPLSLGRGITTTGKILRTGGDIAAQSALAGAGAADEGDRLTGAAQGAALGTAIGGGANVAGRMIRSGIINPAMSRLPEGGFGIMRGAEVQTPETFAGYNVRPDYARERLAELLERDAQARIMTGVEPGQEAVMGARRLRKLGPEAPIASTGSNTLAEIDMLANLSGSAGRKLEMQQRRVAEKRGGAITKTAELATGVMQSADDELVNLAKRQADAAGPLYNKLRTVTFPIDEELQSILGRARLDLGAAQRTATRRGEPQVALRQLKQGDQLPFAAADQLKRTLWDKAKAAKRADKNNEAADLDRLRLDLVKKLDSLSPDYAKARETFAGFGELETAVELGQDSLLETAESLSKLTKEMTPSELEAFRVGAVDSLRQVAGSQAGQTRLLNMYKEPELKGKLRAIFGNDFRKFQRMILSQEELKKLERVGGGSQTFKRLAQAQDQKDTFDLVQASQAATNPVGFVQGLQQKATQYGMPEQQRNKLAQLLMLRDQPAQNELQNMQEYMRRRAMGQALGRQTSGRIGAFGAGQE